MIYVIAALLVLSLTNVVLIVFLIRSILCIKKEVTRAGSMTTANYKNIREILTTVLLSMRNMLIYKEQYEDVKRVDAMLKDTARGTFWDKERRDREIESNRCSNK